MSPATRLRQAHDLERVTDADLLARVAAGEQDALGPLFDRHVAAVRRVVLRLGVGRGDLDDLVQATFLDVLGAAASYDGRPSARPWLIGLAVICVRRHRRSLARIAARMAAWAREPEPVGDRPDLAAEARVEAERAQRAIARLSHKKREAFVLATLEGMSGEEVAAALGIPLATVWTRLHHARRELRAALEGDGA